MHGPGLSLLCPVVFWSRGTDWHSGHRFLVINADTLFGGWGVESSGMVGPAWETCFRRRVLDLGTEDGECFSRQVKQ